MTATRRLAAIMAIDIVGYSRLMGEDEAGTARSVREHREAARPVLAALGGRIVKRSRASHSEGAHLQSTMSTPTKRLKQWLNRFDGVATKNLPSYLGGAEPSKLGVNPSTAKMDPQRHRKRAIPTDNAIMRQRIPHPATASRGVSPTMARRRSLHCSDLASLTAALLLEFRSVVAAVWLLVHARPAP